MFQISLVKNGRINYNFQLEFPSVDKINLIDVFSIALSMEFPLFSFPNKRVMTILSSVSVKMFASMW